MRVKGIAISALICLSSSVAHGETIEIHFEYARMDTCQALPQIHSYRGMAVEELSVLKPYMPELIDPRISTLQVGESDSLHLIWGKSGGSEDAFSFYLADDQAGSASSLTFESVERWKREFFESSVTIPAGRGRAPALHLTLVYNPGRNTMMYRRSDFRLGSATIGGRTFQVALVSGNELAFRKAGGSFLLIDQNADGHFQLEGLTDASGSYRISEAYGLDQPIPVGAGVLEVGRVAADGLEMELIQSELTTGLNVGLQVPDVRIETLDGKSVNLAELEGNILVLNWWHTRCMPCITEMPGMNEVVAKYADDNVVFLAIADNDAGELEGFFEKHKFDYTIALCSDKLKAMLGDAFPRHLIVDTAGVVVYDETGGSPRTGKKLDSVISALW